MSSELNGCPMGMSVGTGMCFGAMFCYQPLPHLCLRCSGCPEGGSSASVSSRQAQKRQCLLRQPSPLKFNQNQPFLPTLFSRGFCHIDKNLTQLPQRWRSRGFESQGHGWSLSPGDGTQGLGPADEKVQWRKGVCYVSLIPFVQSQKRKKEQTPYNRSLTSTRV